MMFGQADLCPGRGDTSSRDCSSFCFGPEVSGQPFRLVSGNIVGFSRQSGALFVWVVCVLGGKAS